MTKPFFQVDDLNAWFFTRQGVIKSVRDISFDLRRGEVLGIVGESGSGKSVTGMSIMGQIDEPGRIVSGSIALDGEELTALSFEEMRSYRGRKIAMVFQNPLMTLNPLMRVRDQMYEAIGEHESVSRREMHDRCIAALNAVGIPSPEERLNAYPHEMSGGMRQRVVIATALLMNPDMIIADEPTTALDVTIQAQIIYHIRRQIDERGLGMIWITHDLSTLSELADRIMVMYAGATMEVGTTEEIIGAARHPYTRKLLDSVPSRNVPGEKLKQIPGNMPSLLALGKGCPFANRCERATEICNEPVPATEASATHRIWCYHPFED
ncbi:dipeptide/oligopeptide ABC transporter ATP-binding protein (plasmid) [Rhizobium gallicum]|uniref:Dipeptide/oligopeptide ABC transporter ATP-binding protein n=1 Tax=Rhizobium gallicum TaxID=56730 RepID=A0A1L5NVE8_9HYPH|nr:ABC transporter ATP-binding protein [Rhizobium gallicum]APO71870.1 dipeptide/oligopeptide ABC transporter ATP-binding protein [Rhizobium gallicum]